VGGFQVVSEQEVAKRVATQAATEAAEKAAKEQKERGSKEMHDARIAHPSLLISWATSRATSLLPVISPGLFHTPRLLIMPQSNLELAKKVKHSSELSSLLVDLCVTLRMNIREW
jgi:hypothetical protein